MATANKKKETEIKREIAGNSLPNHIAIIMDGNGRWAKNHSFPRIRGHRQGIKAVRQTVRSCRELGVKVLSLYAFSEENWKRPPSEVKALMTLLKRFVISERSELMDNDISLIATGNISRLPGDVRKELDKSIQMTSEHESMTLNLALSYSGRDEIVRAVNLLIKKIQSDPEKRSIDQNVFAQYLDTKNLPDPDLLIRTSGEQRISNFMLWQLAYTEIYVTDVLWPDFRKIDLFKAIKEFQRRERRFGLTSEQLPKDNITTANY